MSFLLILMVTNHLGHPIREFEYQTASYDQCQRMGKNASSQLNVIFKKHKMTVKFDCEDIEFD